MQQSTQSDEPIIILTTNAFRIPNPQTTTLNAAVLQWPKQATELNARSIQSLPIQSISLQSEPNIEEVD